LSSSEHNETITYTNHSSGLLEVEGKGALCREDAGVWPAPDKRWADEYTVLSITEGITEVGEGFLETFRNMDCLILSRSVRAIGMTEKLRRLLRKNKVLIRGAYDTFAEAFAAENGLPFLQADIPLAVDRDEAHHETAYLTLRFHENGKADIHCNVFSPGSSAGNNGGGEHASELPDDFCVGCTVEAFAGNFPERLRGELLQNAELARFLEAANRRKAPSPPRRRGDA